MYAYIKGTLTYKNYPVVVLEAGGVGYKISTTTNTIGKLPELGETVTEWGVCSGSEIEGGDYIEDLTTVTVSVTTELGTTEYTPDANGNLDGIEIIGPTLQITTDNLYANIVDFVYLADTKIYIDKRIKALTGKG